MNEQLLMTCERVFPQSKQGKAYLDQLSIILVINAENCDDILPFCYRQIWKKSVQLYRISRNYAN